LKKKLLAKTPASAPLTNQAEPAAERLFLLRGKVIVQREIQSFQDMARHIFCGRLMFSLVSFSNKRQLPSQIIKQKTAEKLILLGGFLFER
jgi:hypothetical protein